MKHRNYISIFGFFFNVSIHKNFPHGSIGHPMVSTNNRRSDFILFNQSCTAINDHFTGHGQPVHAFIKAAYPVGQSHRQHGQNSIYQIYTCTSVKSFFVYYRFGFHIITNISNINSQEKVPATFFCIDCIIQVLSIFPVNSDNSIITTVQPLF